jgi:hypothetical protein
MRTVAFLFLLSAAACTNPSPGDETVDQAESGYTEFPSSAIVGHYVQDTSVPEPPWHEPWHELYLNADGTFARLETFNCFQRFQRITAWVHGRYHARYNRFDRSNVDMQMNAMNTNVSLLNSDYLVVGERDGKRTIRFGKQALIEAP